MPAIASPQTGQANALHVNQELSTFSLNYRPVGFIAEELFPVIPVAHMSDQYLVWDKGQALRVKRTDGKGSLVADGAEAEELDFGGTQAAYQAKKYALKSRVTDLELANQDSAWAIQTSKIAKVQDNLLIDFELRVASLCTTSGNFAASNLLTLTTTGRWNDPGFTSQTNGQHSVILQELLTAINAIRQSAIGRPPNVIVIPFAVAQVMRNDPGLVDLVKYMSGDVNTGANILPAELLGMKVLIPRSQYITSIEGEAVTPTDIWGKNVFLAYVDPNPGLNTLTFGSTFRFRPWMVKQYRWEPTESTYYEASLVQDEKLVSADCGYLIQNAIV